MACLWLENLLLLRAHGFVVIYAWIIYRSNFKSFRHDLLLVIYRSANILSELLHQLISVALLWPRPPTSVPPILRPPPPAQHKRRLIMTLPSYFVLRSRRHGTSLAWHHGCLQVSNGISLLADEGCLALPLPGLQVPLLHKVELLLKGDTGWGLQLVCQILDCLVKGVGTFS